MRKNVIRTFVLVVIFCAPFVSPPATAQGSKPLTIGVSYDQIMNYLDKFISMSRSSDVDGQPRYMGHTSNQMALLEIVGDKADVSQATIMIALRTSSVKTLALNAAMVVRFMKNVAPKWSGGSDWATEAIKQSKSTGKPQQIIRGNKAFEASFLKSLGLASVTVKHKGAL